MAEKFLNYTGLAHLIEKIKARFTTNESRIEAVETAQSTGDTKVDGLETNVQELTTNVTQAQSDISRLDNEQDSQDARLQALEDADQNFLMKSGGQMSGDIDMNENAVTNVKDPSQNGDAANKRYVDSVVSGAVPPGKYLSTDGGTMSGDIDMGNHKVTNVATPVEGTDAANADYVNAAVGVLSTNVTQAQQAAEAASEKADAVDGKMDDYMLKDNGQGTGRTKLNVLNVEGIGVGTYPEIPPSEGSPFPTLGMNILASPNNTQGTFKAGLYTSTGSMQFHNGHNVQFKKKDGSYEQVDMGTTYVHDNLYVEGDEIQVGGNDGTRVVSLMATETGLTVGTKLEGVSDPEDDYDAVNKGYADMSYLSLENGGTVNGDITMAPTARITGIATPERDSDAVNKKYVDQAVGNIDVDHQFSKSTAFDFRAVDKELTLNGINSEGVIFIVIPHSAYTFLVNTATTASAMPYAFNAVGFDALSTQEYSVAPNIKMKADGHGNITISGNSNAFLIVYRP